MKKAKEEGQEGGQQRRLGKGVRRRQERMLGKWARGRGEVSRKNIGEVGQGKEKGARKEVRGRELGKEAT